KAEEERAAAAKKSHHRSNSSWDQTAPAQGQQQKPTAPSTARPATARRHRSPRSSARRHRPLYPASRPLSARDPTTTAATAAATGAAAAAPASSATVATDPSSPARDRLWSAYTRDTQLVSSQKQSDESKPKALDSILNLNQIATHSFALQPHDPSSNHALQ